MSSKHSPYLLVYTKSASRLSAYIRVVILTPTAFKALPSSHSLILDMSFDFLLLIFTFLVFATPTLCLPLENTVVYPLNSTKRVRADTPPHIANLAVSSHRTSKHTQDCKKLRLRGVQTRTCTDHMVSHTRADSQRVLNRTTRSRVIEIPVR